MLDSKRCGIAPEPQNIRAHLARILASDAFRASEALRRFLRYTVEAALAGKGADLKEYTIAVEALGRPASFDPRADNIVRVQARKLRQRLTAYYAGEGIGDRCRISFRPGSYEPIFSADDSGPVATRRVAVLPFINMSADDDAGPLRFLGNWEGILQSDGPVVARVAAIATAKTDGSQHDARTQRFPV